MPGKPSDSSADADRRLDAYRHKRSAEVTPEPSGFVAPETSLRPGLFVVQKHAARRMHFDLRLEMEGVLKSWAVPRGPCLDPNEKRLAVATEDHPVEYGDFEGIIPEGSYGAGAMIVWDRGVWVPLEDPLTGMDRGKLLFELQGYKLRGTWTLFRTHGRGKKDGDKEWLLVKKPDGWARPQDEPVAEESILSGLTVEELRDGVDRCRDIRRELESSAAPRRRVDPGAVKPMLAKTGERPFSRRGWIFELKYDGFRLLASRVNGRPQLHYRHGNDATHVFPDLARALAALPVESLIVDGEVVVLDRGARPSFQRLQRRVQLQRSLDIEQAAAQLPATFFAFDLLAFEDFDLRGLALLERKRLLRRLLPPTGPLRYCDHIETSGEELYREIAKMGLEGMMAKDAQSSYVGRRSASWIKVRVDRVGDFAVVGFTRPRGSRAGFGALHLAVWRPRDDGEPGLAYAGRVGSGFSETQLQSLSRELEARVRPEAPCTGPVPRGEAHVWVEPRLVCEVRYKEWTQEGLLRQPVFERLRHDKEMEECVLERPVGPLEPPSGQGMAPASSSKGPVSSQERVVHYTNRDKVFWPDAGYTKGDLIDFYRAVSPWMLPYLRDRPMVLTRYPDGIDGKSFYQKNAPEYVPDWLQTVTIWSEQSQRQIEYFVCQDLESLLFVANLGAILLHMWSSRLQSLELPDWCILDLDPKEAPFRDVVRVARAVRSVCTDIGLETFIKTSGSTGLHVLIPLGGRYTYQQSQLLGALIARLVARDLPEIATTERVVGKRQGKVYLDYVQNGHGRLLVCPLSVRPLPGAPVSTPLRWSEVTSRLDPKKFDLRTVPRRLAEGKRDPLAPVLTRTADLASALESLAQRLGE